MRTGSGLRSQLMERLQAHAVESLGVKFPPWANGVGRTAKGRASRDISVAFSPRQDPGRGCVQSTESGHNRESPGASCRGTEERHGPSTGQGRKGETAAVACGLHSVWERITHVERG